MYTISNDAFILCHHYPQFRQENVLPFGRDRLECKTMSDLRGRIKNSKTVRI